MVRHPEARWRGKRQKRGIQLGFGADVVTARPLETLYRGERVALSLDEVATIDLSERKVWEMLPELSHVRLSVLAIV